MIRLRVSARIVEVAAVVKAVVNMMVLAAGILTRVPERRHDCRSFCSFAHSCIPRQPAQAPHQLDVI